MAGCGSDFWIGVYRCNDCELQIIWHIKLEEEIMLNEEIQVWIDFGFSEEEAIAMANAMKDRYDDVEITDDVSIASHTE